jgi:ribosomal protein S21
MKKGHVQVNLSECYGDMNRMIKKFMKKVKNEKIIEDFRRKDFFEKPSVVNARKRKRRKKVLQKLNMQRSTLETKTERK